MGRAETTDAFVRAHEVDAWHDRDTNERLAADYGLWAGSFSLRARRAVRAMRAHAAGFPAATSRRGPDSPEAGGRSPHNRGHALVRRRVFFGSARDLGTGAGALPTRARRRSGLFASDTTRGLRRPCCMLALTLWPLGHIGRAVPLVERRGGRGSPRLAHVVTRAFGTIVRGHVRADASAICRGAAINGIELASTSLAVREHDLPFWRAFGVFLRGLGERASGSAAG